jgi:hypothetical protein
MNWVIWLMRNDLCFNRSMWHGNAGIVAAIGLHPCSMQHLVARCKKGNMNVVVANL